MAILGISMLNFWGVTHTEIDPGILANTSGLNSCITCQMIGIFSESEHSFWRRTNDFSNKWFQPVWRNICQNGFIFSNFRGEKNPKNVNETTNHDNIKNWTWNALMIGGFQVSSFGPPKTTLNKGFYPHVFAVQLPFLRSYLQAPKPFCCPPLVGWGNWTSRYNRCGHRFFGSMERFELMVIELKLAARWFFSWRNSSPNLFCIKMFFGGNHQQHGWFRK